MVSIQLPEPLGLPELITNDFLFNLINKNVLLSENRFGTIIEIDPMANSLDEMKIKIIIQGPNNTNPPLNPFWIYRTCSFSGFSGATRYQNILFSDIIKK